MSMYSPLKSAEKMEQVVKTSLRYENLESIYVNSHMYTVPSEVICNITNSCEMVVSNRMETSPLDMCRKAMYVTYEQITNTWSKTG